MYFDTRDLFSHIKMQIYDKEVIERVKVNISYKFLKDLNTFLFDSATPKICHSRFYQSQLASNYLHVAAQ